MGKAQAPVQTVRQYLQNMAASNPESRIFIMSDGDSLSEYLQEMSLAKPGEWPDEEEFLDSEVTVDKVFDDGTLRLSAKEAEEVFYLDPSP